MFSRKKTSKKEFSDLREFYTIQKRQFSISTSFRTQNITLLFESQTITNNPVQMVNDLNKLFESAPQKTVAYISKREDFK